MKKKGKRAGFFQQLAMFAVTIPAMSIVHAQEFSYNGDDGPAYWAELNGDWEACAAVATDARQSPIDIAKVKVDPQLGRLDLHTYPTTIDMFNNGHTIEQHYANTGSYIVFDNRSFELQQFHFHTYSEHTIQRDHGVMEMHGVFTDPSVGDNLVIGVLFEVGNPAKPNEFIQTLIDAGLPEKNGDVIENEDLIDFRDGLTSRKRYYTYTGSLTTPPCSETVTWIVLAKRAKLTREQLESFRTILGNNFRPTQDRNGRTVRATPGTGSPRS